MRLQTGASAAYLGMCEELKETSTPADGEDPVETVKDMIKYTASTSNNKFMVGKSLVKEPVAEGEVSTQQGILTFDLFQKVLVAIMPHTRSQLHLMGMIYCGI